MGIRTKKNIGYWFNYCTKNKLRCLYLVNTVDLKNNGDENVQQYRIVYSDMLEGYMLEVFNTDRFIYAIYTSLWDIEVYEKYKLEDIEVKEKYIVRNGVWTDKNTGDVEPVVLKDDEGNVVIEIPSAEEDEVKSSVIYHDFTKNKLLQ